MQSQRPRSASISAIEEKNVTLTPEESRPLVEP